MFIQYTFFIRTIEVLRMFNVLILTNFSSKCPYCDIIIVICNPFEVKKNNAGKPLYEDNHIDRRVET